MGALNRAVAAGALALGLLAAPTAASAYWQPAGNDCFTQYIGASYGSTGYPTSGPAIEGRCASGTYQVFAICSSYQWGESARYGRVVSSPSVSRVQCAKGYGLSAYSVIKLS